MARVAKFKQGDSGTELDLLAGSGAGWNIQSWYPKIAVPNADGALEPVQEEMVCIVKGSSDDNLATQLQAMQQMRQYAAWYNARETWITPVWIHLKTDGETNTGRALVLNSKEYPFEMEFQSQPTSQTGEIEQDKARVKLSFWRMPAWEKLNSVLVDDGWSSNGPAHVLDYGASPNKLPAGDIPGRHSGSFGPVSSSDKPARLWCGIRSDAGAAAGDASGFEAIWELEDGTQEDADATLQTDGSDTASPYGGANPDHIQVSEGTSGTDWADGDFHLAWSIQMQDVVSDANIGNNFGLILELLRAKVDADTTWEVRLALGYPSMDDAERKQTLVQEITATSWDLHEIDVISVPSHKIKGISTVAGWPRERWFEIQIWLRRTTGIGDCYLDCLCPVPIDEGYLKVWDSQVGDAGDRLDTQETPLGEFDVILTDDSAPQGYIQTPPFVANNFRLPPGPGCLVTVYARQATSVLSDRIAVSFVHVERWLSMRGSE